MTLGSATVVPAADARTTAQQMHARARLGQDPGQAKIDARTQASIAETLRTYLAYQRGHVRPKTYVEIERYLLKDFKTLHGLPLARVDRQTVAARLSALTADKGRVTANRARATLSAFFSWAMKQGLTESNPVIGTNQHKEKSRERVLSNDELKLIWNALDETD
jgi:site-specific recombinase XerD